jgi:hypothetical protein
MSLKNHPVSLLIVLLLTAPVLSACNPGSDSEPGALPTGQTIEVTYTPVPNSGEALVEEAGAAEAPTPATIEEFKQALATALTSEPRDYTALENLMGDSFEIMIWYGNGEQMTPAEAVTAFQSAFLPAGNHVTYSELADIDTESLFRGNPFQLYPNAVDFLFSQGWGESGKDEALLYIGQAADGTYYWQGVLYANDGFEYVPQELSWVPIPTDLCTDLQATISGELGLATGTMEENTDFYDVATGTTGRGCRVTITGTGADGLGNPYDIFQQLSGVMQSMGWTPDVQHAVDGPTGTGGGFVRDSGLIILIVGWEPSDAANCPDDQPISSCDVAPENKLYTITIEGAMQ